MLFQNHFGMNLSVNASIFTNIIYNQQHIYTKRENICTFIRICFSTFPYGLTYKEIIQPKEKKKKLTKKLKFCKPFNENGRKTKVQEIPLSLQIS